VLPSNATNSVADRASQGRRDGYGRVSFRRHYSHIPVPLFQRVYASADRRLLEKAPARLRLDRFVSVPLHASSSYGADVIKAPLFTFVTMWNRSRILRAWEHRFKSCEPASPATTQGATGCAGLHATQVMTPCLSFRIHSAQHQVRVRPIAIPLYAFLEWMTVPLS
jgi:hypothetical protein